MKRLISIVIPAYNESANIAELTKRLAKLITTMKDCNFEVIVVENASRDNTHALLLQQRKKCKWIKILQLAKNAGCDGAIIAGLSFAKGDVAFILMADLQEDPMLLPKFIKKWEQGYDVVYGVVKSRSNSKLYKKIGAAIYYKVLSGISNNVIIENVSDFRLIDRKVYTVIAEMPEHNKFFRGISSWTGFRQTGIPINRGQRFAGESKADLKTLIRVALNGIFSFSYLPLRIGWALAILLVITSIILLYTNEVALSMVSLLFALIFFQISIMSEYMIKIIDEVRNRPNFIIKSKTGL